MHSLQFFSFMWRMHFPSLALFSDKNIVFLAIPVEFQVPTSFFIHPFTFKNELTLFPFHHKPLQQNHLKLHPVLLSNHSQSQQFFCPSHKSLSAVFLLPTSISIPDQTRLFFNPQRLNPGAIRCQDYWCRIRIHRPWRSPSSTRSPQALLGNQKPKYPRIIWYNWGGMSMRMQFHLLLPTLPREKGTQNFN